MSETTILAVAVAAITGLPATIAALAAWRQGKSNSEKTDHNTVITEATKKETELLVVKTDEIHDLANSQLAKVTAQLAASELQIKDLQSLVKSLAESQKRNGGRLQ